MTENYGVLKQKSASNEIEIAIEELMLLGYSTISSGYSLDYLNQLRDACFKLSDDYHRVYGKEHLQKLGESNSYRGPLLMNKIFLEVARNNKILKIVSNLILGRSYLNQQNLVINPPFGGQYSQLRFHRDLPYQHYTSSRPLAINALLAIDDFTIENGATVVVPATHKSESFPSERVIERNSIQIPVKSGTFLLLDCMTYHAAAKNMSERNRIGLNHVYSTLMLRPQIDWVRALGKSLETSLSTEERKLLALDYSIPENVRSYLENRQQLKPE